MFDVGYKQLSSDLEPTHWTSSQGMNKFQKYCYFYGHFYVQFIAFFSIKTTIKVHLFAIDEFILLHGRRPSSRHP